MNKLKSIKYVVIILAAVIVVALLTFILSPEKSQVQGFDNLLKTHGEPERIMYSTDPNNASIYYTYPQKGFAVIVKDLNYPDTYELWNFEPLTLNAFKEKYKDTVQDDQQVYIRLDYAH